MAINMQNGLFGLGGFGGGMPEMPQQMAGLYDPQAARRGKLKSVLTQTGLAMLGQGPSAMPINFGTSLGQGLMAGVKAGDETENQYRDMAYQTFKINQDAENQKYGREQDQKQWDWKAKEFDYNSKRQGINDTWDSQYRKLQMEKMQADIKKTQTADARARLGLNPQYGVDANGNPVLLQIGEDGAAVQTQMPDGVRLSKEPIKLDAGSHFVLLDPITRQPIGQIPKDLAGAERDKALGDAQGKSLAAAGGDISAADTALDLLGQIKTSPYLESGTGLSSYGNVIPGTGGYDFQNLVDNATSGAFLAAIQQMRGMGSLSNAEGDAATRAINRMNTATSKEAFLKAVADYEAIVVRGKGKAEGRMADPAAINPQAVPAPIATDGKSLKQKYGLE